jgi:uncharacterized protein YlxW (UPF0749 family)
MQQIFLTVTATGVSLWMLKSINEIAKLVRNDRATVARRAEELRLIPEDGKGIGDNKAKLYDTHQLLQLVPLPSRSSKSESSNADTLEDARIRSENAKAEKTELEVEKMKGNLADVGEVLSAQNEIFDNIAAIIKKSTMSDADKEDCLGEIGKAARIWGG